jgi:AraC family transcriptional regulator
MRTRDLLCVLRDLSVSRSALPGSSRPAIGGLSSLKRIAQRAGWSPFHLQREFLKFTGESPKRFTQRVRLEYAAARLLASEEPVARIAHAAGFASHEVFTRAFRRAFGCVPGRYRSRRHPSTLARAERVALTSAISPCVRLFRLPLHERNTQAMPLLQIERQDRPEQPLLLIRRRIARSELQPMLAECFGKLFTHGHTAGLPIAGWPLARYVSMGPGLWTVEAAMPLATAVAGVGEMEAGSLPAGPVAFGLHAGPYEQLPDSHAAIEKWMESKGYRAGGPPWESYVTDPGQLPDPADWRTEVYWPLAN